MRAPIVPKTTLSMNFDCQIIDGSLFYKTQAEDGTPTLRPLNRPKDLDKGLLRDLRNMMTPEERRTLTASDILRILRDGARIADPLPEPWAVNPEADCRGVLARSFGIEHVVHVESKSSKKRTEKAVTFPLALASGVLARHRDPSARIAPLFVFARPSEAPKVLAMVSALTSGRVHEHGPGHGEAPPGTLAEVWRTPPYSAPSGLWLDIRGDSRTVRPVPVILCNPHDFDYWFNFFVESSRYGRFPLLSLYKAVDPEPLNSYVAEAVWSGLLSMDDMPSRPRKLTLEEVFTALHELERYLDGSDDPPEAPTLPNDPPEAPRMPHGPPVE